MRLESGRTASVGVSHLTGKTLSVRSPDEPIAVIPHLLGFKPKKSLALLPMSSALPMASVDLPTTPHDREVVRSSIDDCYDRHAQPGSSLAIVCLSTDRQTPTGVARELSARFDSTGSDARVMLWADETRWADLDSRWHGPPGRSSARARSLPPPSCTTMHRS